MIRFTLNGQPQESSAPPDRSLAAHLREDLHLTGTKIACAIGRCGACTVLLDGVAANACLLMLWQVEGRAITTIEGLPPASPLQAALAEANAFQCGYCAPGIVLALTGLFAADPQADEAAIRTALEGHLCRCTGYHSILRGALAARDLIQAALEGDP